MIPIKMDIEAMRLVAFTEDDNDVEDFSDSENELEDAAMPMFQQNDNWGRGRARAPPYRFSDTTQDPLQLRFGPLPSWEESIAMRGKLQENKDKPKEQSQLPVQSQNEMKPNGFGMFLLHMAEINGVETPVTIDDLIIRFNKDWKALPESEREEWRGRATEDSKSSTSDSEKNREITASSSHQ